MSNPSDTLSERFFHAVVGALTGAAYGLLIAIAIFLVKEAWHAPIVGWSAGVFAILGFFFGNVVIEALLALIHFVWGLLNGYASASEWERPRDDGTTGYLRSVMLLGFGTGVVLAIGFWPI